MAALKQFIAGLLVLHSPVWPHHWWKFARGLASGNGWMPPMFLWAIFGVVASLNFGIGRQPNIPWLERFHLLGWATWAIVAVLGMLITCGQSASTIRRLGPFGPTRPRWWFEIARVSWNATTIAFIGIMMGLFMNNQQRPLFTGVFTVLFNTLRIAFPVFFGAASIGYLVSFVRRLPRNGRAYDCVHYFYFIIGSLGIITYAAILTPPQPNLRTVAVPILIGIIGIVWLVLGFISIIRRFEAWDRNHKAA